MTHYALNLPTELKDDAERLAKEQGISLDQFILWSVAEKVGGLLQMQTDSKSSNAASLPERSETKAGEQPADYAVAESQSSLDWAFPNIEIVEGTGGRSAVIRGTRIYVYILVGYFLVGETPETLTTEVIPHVTLAQVYEAMRYYFVHRAEIDKEREESAEEASRRMLLERLGEKKYKEIVSKNLSAEFAAWESASDEALENFEKGLDQP